MIRRLSYRVIATADPFGIPAVFTGNEDEVADTNKTHAIYGIEVAFGCIGQFSGLGTCTKSNRSPSESGTPESQLGHFINTLSFRL